ncbi:MAG: agmatinase [Bacteroidales bacterium]
MSDIPKTFADIPEEYAAIDSAAIVLQAIPYDGTSTYVKGADRAFEEFMKASPQIEYYDIETDSEVYRQGIAIVPEIGKCESPSQMVDEVYSKTKELLETGKFLTFLGGEHSVSIGVLRAFSERYNDLSVLHLDAHADLRKEYQGSPFNHACAMHEVSQRNNLVQVGIRSMDISELEYCDKAKTFFAHDIHGNDVWMDKAVEELGDNVYISLDLDALDPSIMPSTGTPEPGGLQWYQCLNLLRKVFEKRNVVGFDLVELAPTVQNHASTFLVVKLFYKMLSYKFAHKI